MKANELMIGDWVLDGTKIAQVTSILCDGAIETTFNSSSNIEVIEPIPLTQEILEKNGFVLESYCGNVMPGKWWTRNDFVIHENMNDSVGKNNFKYEYVHQLQHALRLCGIEKEIEL